MYRTLTGRPRMCLKNNMGGTPSPRASLSQARRLGFPEATRSYYEVLRVTPKATQAQVKDAYYNLSKTYHPDQYKGQEDAAVLFREITEAYEVLGNFHKRRLYDKGLLGTSAAATPTEAEEYSKRFYESRSKRGRAPAATGRTPIYNFDEWSKLHYEASRERRENAKERYARMQRIDIHNRESRKSDIVVSVVVLLLILYSAHTSQRQDVDKPKSK